MSSADILDTTKSGGEMAVRLAIGESQIVGENRSYFASHGVDIDILESTHSTNKAAARSTTTLLVKNLPASAVPDELESMFARYGSIAGSCVPAAVMGFICMWSLYQPEHIIVKAAHCQQLFCSPPASYYSHTTLLIHIQNTLICSVPGPAQQDDGAGGLRGAQRGPHRSERSCLQVLILCVPLILIVCSHCDRDTIKTMSVRRSSYTSSSTAVHLFQNVCACSLLTCCV